MTQKHIVDETADAMGIDRSNPYVQDALDDAKAVHDTMTEAGYVSMPILIPPSREGDE